MEDEQPVRNGIPYGVNSDVPGRANRRRGDPDADYASSGDELDDDDADFYRWLRAHAASRE